MKKKLSLILCLIVCLFSFTLVGCSGLSDAEKKSLQNAADKMTEFTNNQAQANKDLLDQLEAEQETNKELLDKIGELTEEISKLKEEKELSQDEMKAEFQKLLLKSMQNSNNYVMKAEGQSYSNGKSINEESALAASVYNKDADVLKVMYNTTYRELVFDDETEDYVYKYYDLTTGNRIAENQVDEYVKNSMDRESQLYKFLTTLYGVAVDYLSVFDIKDLLEAADESLVLKIDEVCPQQTVYDLTVLEDGKIKVDFYTICKFVNGANFWVYEVSCIFDSDRLISADMNVTYQQNEGNQDLFTGKIHYDFEYVNDFDKADYIVQE